MRVITGSARGRNLETLKGTGIVRPTSQMIKETMFSSVQFHIPAARTLDLFAGCGQLGIEALSRGAKSCVFVDNQAAACSVIRKNLELTGLSAVARVVNRDAYLFLGQARQVFDLILMDPPYRQGHAERILPMLDALLADRGMALCETESGIQLDGSYGAVALKKSYHHGRVTVWLYCKG